MQDRIFDFFTFAGLVMFFVGLTEWVHLGAALTVTGALLAVGSARASMAPRDKRDR